MQLPSFSLHGSGREQLCEQYCDVHLALNRGREALISNGPNARDYDDHAAFETARSEHRDRIVRLDAIMAEIMAIADHCA
jgi:hypothetical protein